MAEVLVHPAAYIRTAGRCHKHYALAALAVVLSGCTAEAPERTYSRVWSLYTSGALAQAAETAAKEAKRFNRPTDVAWFWKFQLLGAEALLAQGKVAQAVAI